MWTYDFAENDSILCKNITILASALNPSGDTEFVLEFITPDDRLFEVGATSHATITVEGRPRPDVEGELG